MSPFDVDEFLRAVADKAAVKILRAEPLPPTGWDIPLDFAREHGRARLVQVAELPEEAK